MYDEISKKHKQKPKSIQGYCYILPRYRVFIAYGGRQGRRVARFVAECLHNNGINPRIALQGAIGEIRCASQEEIFEEMARCDAVVAVNAKYASQSLKFRDEVESARYDLRKPMVVFVRDGSRTFHMLRVRATRIEFDEKRYRRKCDELVSALRKDIAYSRPAGYVPEGKRLPRRVLRD